MVGATDSPQRKDGVVASRRRRIDPAILDPRTTWADPVAYNATARRLVNLVAEKFGQFEDIVEASVRDAAPGMRLHA